MQPAWAALVVTVPSVLVGVDDADDVAEAGGPAAGLVGISDLTWIPLLPSTRVTD